MHRAISRAMKDEFKVAELLFWRLDLVHSFLALFLESKRSQIARISREALFRERFPQVARVARKRSRLETETVLLRF